jgi:endonuclease/exonuclease/phosphatase family metal-dependent hydrolase
VLRVMTWNLWWRFGPWWQRQSAIASVLRATEPDVVGLQEVWAEEDGANQATVLGRQLGFHVAHGELRYKDGVAFTNAILCRWPLMAVACTTLPGADGRPSHRSALAADVAAPFGTFAFCTTHLDWAFDGSATRVAQTSAVARFVDGRRGSPAVSFPAVLTGDFNALPHTDEMRQLTGASAPPVPGLVFTDAWDVAGGGLPGYTWDGANPYLADATWPNRRLDYVLVSWPRPKPLGSVTRVCLAGTEPVGGVMASDHFAVVADLRTA